MFPIVVKYTRIVVQLTSIVVHYNNGNVFILQCADNYYVPIIIKFMRSARLTDVQMTNDLEISERTTRKRTAHAPCKKCLQEIALLKRSAVTVDDES